MIQFRFYKLYIRGTVHKQEIALERDFLCNIKPSLVTILSGNSDCTDRRVYLSTKSLKHIYDRHIYDKGNFPEFMIILQNLTRIIRYPDEVRMDMESKRGDFLFIKQIEERPYFVSLQITHEGGIEVVSSSATGESYTKKFTLLWSWGSANPPS